MPSIWPLRSRLALSSTAASTIHFRASMLQSRIRQTRVEEKRGPGSVPTQPSVTKPSVKKRGGERRPRVDPPYERSAKKQKQQKTAEGLLTEGWTGTKKVDAATVQGGSSASYSAALQVGQEAHSLPLRRKKGPTSSGGRLTREIFVESGDEDRRCGEVGACACERLVYW